MRSEFLPYTRPTIDETDVAAVTDALCSGWITSGPRTGEFERLFAARVGAPEAIAVSSATAGLHLTLAAAEIGPGDEVVTPSFTWPAAVNMIERTGARPVFADIDPDSLQLSVPAVSSCVGPRTRLVLPVHFAGNACDLSALRELCRSSGCGLLEDAAHALGTEYDGAPIGSGDGLATVFSFHAVKNITTAEGGMVVTRDRSLAERIRSLRFHGVDHDAWRRHGGGKPSSYDLFEPGWKYNLTDLAAALGCAQLERLDRFVEARARLALRYDDALRDVAGISLPSEGSGYASRHSWHLYVIRIHESAGVDRDEFRRRLRERNIGTGLHYPAVHELTYYRRRYPDAGRSLPVTSAVARSVVSLPLFPTLTDDDVDSVIVAVREALA